MFAFERAQINGKQRERGAAPLQAVDGLVQPEIINQKRGHRLAQEQKAGEGERQQRHSIGNHAPGQALHHGAVNQNQADIVPIGGIKIAAVEKQRGQHQRGHAAQAHQQHHRKQRRFFDFMGFADENHRERQHRARGDAAHKAPHGRAVVAKLGAADERHTADGDHEAQ